MIRVNFRWCIKLQISGTFLPNCNPRFFCLPNLCSLRGRKFSAPLRHAIPSSSPHLSFSHHLDDNFISYVHNTGQMSSTAILDGISSCELSITHGRWYALSLVFPPEWTDVCLVTTQHEAFSDHHLRSLLSIVNGCSWPWVPFGLDSMWTPESLIRLTVFKQPSRS